MRIQFTEGTGYRRVWLWPMYVVVWTSVVLAMIAIGYTIYFFVHKSDVEYYRKCEAVNGRVVQIGGGNVCVENGTDKVLWV